MFKHFHPFAPYINEDTKLLIMGTLPPPRFCTGEIKPDDVQFCYGSKDNLLWKLLSNIYKAELLYNNSQKAVVQRKKLLKENQLGICDIVEYCYREKIDASDIGMCEPIVHRDILGLIEEFKEVETIVFMGGLCKNSPEYFLKRILKENSIKYEHISKKEHFFTFNERVIKTVNLTSPSNAANRAIGANPIYKKNKAKDKNYSTFDFRIEEYRRIFNN